jgi:hypothetical protein
MMTGARFVAMGLGPVGAGRFDPKLITGGVTRIITFFQLASSVVPIKRGYSSERHRSGLERSACWYSWQQRSFWPW